MIEFETPDFLLPYNSRCPKGLMDRIELDVRAATYATSQHDTLAETLHLDFLVRQGTRATSLREILREALTNVLVRHNNTPQEKE